MFSNIRILVSEIPSSPVFQYRASRQKSARVYFQALENIFLSETKADVQNEIYIREICKKTICKVGVLLRLRNLIPWSAKLQLYKSNIRPHLTYCDVVWHFCKSFDKKKMERIQECALRAVFNFKSETYSELLTRAALPSLYQQRLQNIAILMYKVKNGLLPTYITEIFNTTPKQYNLKNTDFNIPRFRTVHYGKHSLLYFGPIFGTN